MGWWDRWTTVKETATGWGTSIWNNASLSNAISGTFNFSYNTVASLLEQLPAGLRLLKIAPKPRARKLAKNLGRVAIEDVAPYIFFAYAYSLIEEMGQGYLKGYGDDENLLSVKTGLQLGLYGLWAINMIYSVRKKTQFTLRASLLTIEAASMFNQEKEHLPMTLCVDEKCSTLRFLKGSIRDLIEYWATNAAIYFVGFVPVAGGKLAAAFSVYHNGRYVMTTMCPKLCAPHQAEYLREYSELALAHGITHYVLTQYISSMIAQYSGVPAYYYETIVQQILLILQIGIASQITLPPPVKKSQRQIPDPIASYQKIIGISVNIVGSGIREQLPNLLKGNEPMVPWEKVPDYLYDFWFHPAVEWIKFFIVPRMLRNLDKFSNDPAIRWDELRTVLLDALGNVQTVSEDTLVKTARWAPNTSAGMVSAIFGMPKPLIATILNLMNNAMFMNSLGRARNLIAGGYRGKAPQLLPSEAYPLRIEEKVLTTKSTSVNPLANPQVFIEEPERKSKIVEIHDTNESRVKDSKLSMAPIQTLFGKSGIGEDVLQHRKKSGIGDDEEQRLLNLRRGSTSNMFD